MSAVITAAAATIAAPMAIAAHGLARTDFNADLKAMIITPNSMSCEPIFFKKEANCVRIAFISPPNPKSPAMICPIASAAATMLSVINFDTCWSKRVITSAIVAWTCSNAAENDQPFAVSAVV